MRAFLAGERVKSDSSSLWNRFCSSVVAGLSIIGETYSGIPCCVQAGDVLLDRFEVALACRRIGGDLISAGVKWVGFGSSPRPLRQTWPSLHRHRLRIAA